MASEPMSVSILRDRQAQNEKRESERNYNAPRVNLSLTDFTVMSKTGDGSFSTVVLARHNASGMDYAIKVINKHLVMRNRMVDYIKNERNILDVLNHPGIAKLHFTFQDADSLYMGMEYCPGGELYDQIVKKGMLSMDTTRYYTAELVAILEYLREAKVIHRDLKPENLLLSGSGHLKLIDFGSAKAFFLPPSTRRNSKNRLTSFVGTAEYVSPEVLHNTAISYSADLWALGCLVYQMLAGCPPFKGGSEYLTFQKITERDFTFPPGFDPVAQDLVDKLLQMEPRNRLGAESMSELKAHAFFARVPWQQLFQGRGPDFIPPTPATAEEEALDWELTSLMRDTVKTVNTSHTTNSS